MSRELIFIVDDEVEILELVEFNLNRSGYRTRRIVSGEAALDAVRKDMPDLILLDLMLPGVDGLEVCRQLRADPATANTPIIIMTAKGEDADVVTGLELGAADYVVKPFSPRLLVARVRAILRRQSTCKHSDESPLRVGEITLDLRSHEVRLAGRRVELTLTEFRILEMFARKPGWVFTRYQIISEAQGPDVIVTDRSVDVHIVSLRRKLGQHGSWIETVRGVGYRIADR